MGHPPSPIRAHARAPSLLSLLLLWSFCSTTLTHHSAEGTRPLTVLFQVAGKEGRGGEEMVMVGAMIGSRPPRCEGMCRSCGHCEAVQVPLLEKGKERREYPKVPKVISSRAEDTSNYKPMNWKCKCGQVVLNP